MSNNDVLNGHLRQQQAASESNGKDITLLAAAGTAIGLKASDANLAQTLSVKGIGGVDLFALPEEDGASIDKMGLKHLWKAKNWVEKILMGITSDLGIGKPKTDGSGGGGDGGGGGGGGGGNYSSSASGGGSSAPVSSSDGGGGASSGSSSTASSGGSGDSMASRGGAEDASLIMAVAAVQGVGLPNIADHMVGQQAVHIDVTPSSPPAAAVAPAQSAGGHEMG